MKNLPFRLSAALLLGIVSFVAPAMAQKGNGRAGRRRPGGCETSRESFCPGPSRISKRGPCERTTGRSIEGVHLIVQSQDNKAINLHLGPASALADVIEKLSPGQEITFEAFRTDRMPKDAYVAKSLTAGGKTFALRNDSLRPKWAGPPRGEGRWPGHGRWFGPRLAATGDTQACRAGMMSATVGE